MSPEIFAILSNLEKMAETDVIRVGSRKSQLAMVQTTTIVNRLKEFYPEKKFEIISMSTLGDRILESALNRIGEKSLFTRELEQALLDKSVDFVVHSLKDLPTSMPDGLAIACVYRRDSVCDAVVVHSKHAGKTLDELPEGSVIGTSSVRRMSQLLSKHPTFKFENIRGNLNTRFRKLEVENKYDAIILAEAGLVRMGWENKISQVLDESLPMYAISQGAIAIECRIDDMETRRILATIHDKDTTLQVVAERSFLKTLEGGCGVPACINSHVTEKKVSLIGGVYSLDAKRHKQATCSKELPIRDINENKVKSDPFKMYIGILGNGVVEDDEMTVAYNCGYQLAKDILSTDAADIIRDAKTEIKKQLMQEHEKKEALKLAFAQE